MQEREQAAKLAEEKRLQQVIIDAIAEEKRKLAEEKKKLEE